MWGFGFTLTWVQILTLSNESGVTLDRVPSPSEPLLMGIVAVITLGGFEED